MTRPAIFAALAVALLLSALPLWPAAAQHRCEASVRERLAGLAIAEDQVSKLIFTERRVSRRETSGQLLGFEAWVTLESCPQGSLVLYMSPQCTPRGEYTTGACSVPGVED